MHRTAGLTYKLGFRTVIPEKPKTPAQAYNINIQIPDQHDPFNNSIANSLPQGSNYPNMPQTPMSIASPGAASTMSWAQLGAAAAGGMAGGLMTGPMMMGPAGQAPVMGYIVPIQGDMQQLAEVLVGVVVTPMNGMLTPYPCSVSSMDTRSP